MEKLIARWHKSITEIHEDDWNHLINNQSNPFYRWEWLCALERSGSISARNGWQPLHLIIWRDKYPVAVAPLYLKSHSYGEFIFDQVFANLASQLGINYYPKLLGMSPLSPVEGYRFFYAPNENAEELTALMMNIIDQFSIENGLASCNFLYVDQTWCSLAEATNCAKWINQSSIWRAEDSKNFSDYLGRFNSNQRRNIKRERKAVKDAGINVTALTNDSINKETMQIMHKFYEEHCARWGVWGSKYLSESFFEELAKPEQKNQIVLFSAHRENPEDPLAMSLCIKHQDMLWGRYWGSKAEIDYLHFEVCYYSPISWALEQGISRFDPGAGGSHKRRRGFIAQSNTSLHRWYDKRMDSLIKPWLEKVNKMMLDEIEAANNELPFKIERPKLSSTV